MKRTVLLLAVLCLHVFYFPVALAEEDSKRGKVRLKEYKFGQGNDRDAQVIKLGKDVEFHVNRYIGEFFDEPIINANAKIINNTDEWMQATYLIVFYDKEEAVVGSHAVSWKMKPKDETNFGSALIKGKLEDFKRVAGFYLYVNSYKTVPDKKK